METGAGCLQKDSSLVPVQVPLPADAFLVLGLFLWGEPFRAPAMLVDREMLQIDPVPDSVGILVINGEIRRPSE